MIQAGDRFVRDATAEIVSDTQTGLQWQDDSDTKDYRRDWQSAIAYCEALDTTATSGYDDWRLPNINELYSIADMSIYDPALSGVFENIVSSSYWSSTTRENYHERAWVVYFYNGSVYGSYKDSNRFVRCVRDGQ
jgi:hypothetical protein